MLLLLLLVTCSHNFSGSIKIWDFGSGQCIKEKTGRTSEEDLSITGLMYSKLEDDRILIASGWNNKLKILLVSSIGS
jgi:WD40 repeat protein